MHIQRLIAIILYPIDDSKVKSLPVYGEGWGGASGVVEMKTALIATEVLPIDPALYEVLRYEAGIPMYGVDMDERVLAAEMGAAFEANYISYTKGCYTGQEVLMRIKSRGHTNRTWTPLRVEGEHLPLRGTRLIAPAESGEEGGSPTWVDAGWITGAGTDSWSMRCACRRMCRLNAWSV